MHHQMTGKFLCYEPTAQLLSPKIAQYIWIGPHMPFR